MKAVSFLNALAANPFVSDLTQKAFGVKSRPCRYQQK